MNVVYFSEELSARAPEVVACLLQDDGVTWRSMHDVANAIRRREPVTIRPATESEMKRAEALVALYEIGSLLGSKMEALLDQDPPHEVVGKITEIRSALESTDRKRVELLDRHSVVGTAGA